MQPYHKFVFDAQQRRLVGQFEEMYASEEREGFDSWFERDLRSLRKRISLEILSRYNFASILDVGCGKGTITHLLKKENNRVVGVDISPTAIAKARHSFPDIDFRCLSVAELIGQDESFDLVVVMGAFAYIDCWPDFVAAMAPRASYFYVAEYIPPNAIGFVKSIEQLQNEVRKHYEIKTKLVIDDDHCMLFAESRSRK